MSLARGFQTAMNVPLDESATGDFYTMRETSRSCTGKKWKKLRRRRNTIAVNNRISGTREPSDERRPHPPDRPQLPRERPEATADQPGQRPRPVDAGDRT